MRLESLLWYNSRRVVHDRPVRKHDFPFRDAGVDTQNLSKRGVGYQEDGRVLGEADDCAEKAAVGDVLDFSQVWLSGPPQIKLPDSSGAVDLEAEALLDAAEKCEHVGFRLHDPCRAGYAYKRVNSCDAGCLRRCARHAVDGCAREHRSHEHVAVGSHVEALEVRD